MITDAQTPDTQRGRYVKILKPFFVDISDRERSHSIITYYPDDVHSVLKASDHSSDVIGNRRDNRYGNLLLRKSINTITNYRTNQQQICNGKKSLLLYKSINTITNYQQIYNRRNTIFNKLISTITNYKLRKKTPLLLEQKKSKKKVYEHLLLTYLLYYIILIKLQYSIVYTFFSKIQRTIKGCCPLVYLGGL